MPERRLSYQIGILVVAFALMRSEIALAQTSPVLQSADRQLPQIHPGRTDAIDGEVIVLVNIDANNNGKRDESENLDGLRDSIKGTIERKTSISPLLHVLRVKLANGVSIEAAIAQHWERADPRIVVVEPNFLVFGTTEPNDPRYPELWSFNNVGQTGGTPDVDIDAPEAWQTTSGSPSVIVAVIDSGFDGEHPDLIQNRWRNPGESGGGKETNNIDDDGNGYVDDVYGYDFVGHDNDPTGSHSHGTHVAGIIGARGDDGIGVCGVNWQCALMNCRFLGPNNIGNIFNAIEVINYAVSNGARILNNSWGGPNYSASLEAAIANAADHDVLFVAAAGNNASNIDVSPFYPAGLPQPNIVAVASTTPFDTLNPTSNFGAVGVDLAAPGTAILSCVPTYEILFSESFQGATTPGFSGTSMTLEGPANRWGTVVTPDFPGNIAARSDFANSSPYAPDSDGSIVTPAINTLASRAITISFTTRMDCAGDDYMSIDVFDGANWVTLLTTSAAGYFFNGFVWTTYIEMPDNLRSGSTRFRWRWVTNGIDNNHIGIEVDNISIWAINPDYTNAYALGSGTSMAAPHVSGVAALLLSQNPEMSVSELKSRLLTTGDWVPALSGITVSGRRLNAHSALSAYHSPGDLNCDGVINGRDIAHFVEALLNPSEYDADHDGDPYASCSKLLADCNFDGITNSGDLFDFLAILLN